MKEKSQDESQETAQDPAPEKKSRNTKTAEAAERTNKEDMPTEYPAAVKLINGAAISHTIGGIHVLPYSESDAFIVASSDEMQRLDTDIAALAELYTHYASADGGLVRLALIDKE